MTRRRIAATSPVLVVAFVVAAACSGDGGEANTATGGDDPRGSQGSEMPSALGCEGVPAEAAAEILGVEAVDLSFDDPEHGCGYDTVGTDPGPDLHFLAHRERTSDEAAAQLARHIDFEVSLLLVGPEDLAGVTADEAVHFPGAEGDLVLARRGTTWVEVRAPLDAGVVSALLDALAGASPPAPG